MIYKQIKGIDKKVSALFYGTASEAFLAGGDHNEILDAVVETGINAIDTGRVYGNAEESLGKWLRARNNRSEMVLLSKCGHPDNATGADRISEKEIRADFAVSSELLGTDYIDIYLLHRDNPAIPVGEIVEIMNALKQEGKIGIFGGSNWSTARIQEANAYAAAHGLDPFVVSSPSYGIAEQVKMPWIGVGETLTGPKAAADRAWYRDNDMPVLAYASLGHGMFSGRVKSDDPATAERFMDEFGCKGYAYPVNFETLARVEKMAQEKGVSVPALATAWLLHSDMNVFSIVSSMNVGRMKENAAAADIVLTKEERDYLKTEA
ncbi:MAG: aldo/keto reductase [Lachnospiraceae bacterium]|nr:aldo/keto reductase [Lachnospiraceae bacterium]